MKQKTLKGSFSLFGKGLHTGLNLTVTFNPAAENTGYKIQRIDLEGEPIIDAIAENVIDTQRGTVLGKGEARVSTVEHGLSALYALGIDNCLMQVNGPEFPILDGSAIQYVEKIREVGIEEQNAPKDWYIIRKKIEVKDDSTGSCITILPDEDFSITTMCSFESKFINSQFATLDNPQDYPKEIAPARTFVFVRDIEPLLQANLIKGGDLDNAIVIIDRPVTQEQLDHLAQICNKPRIKVRPEGVLNNLKLHYENEPARHKLLDMIGDLALVGMPIKGRVVAARPGHYANTELVRRIRKAIRTDRKKADIPVYNPGEPPVMTIEDIKEVLPQRPPFLLIDKIIEKKEDAVVGIKNVTMNEPFFVGHFPDEAVMPGVLQIEAMAQVGGILLMDRLDDPKKYNSYFLRVDKVRFRRRVVPGDTLIIRVELGGEVRRGIAMLNGQIYVGDVLVTEGELMIQILKK